MRIGLDIDGVLGGQVEAVLPILNSYLGTNYTKTDWDYWHFARDKVGSNTVLLNMLDAAWMQGLVMPQELDLASTVKKLRKFGPITIISKRTYKSQSHVIQRLQDWGIKYDNVVFVNGNENKLDYPIDILIDDHPDFENHNTYHSDKLLFVREQPWNDELYPRPNVYRVKDLVEVVTLLQILKEQGDLDVK
jgi:hypothetical protein